MSQAGERQSHSLSSIENTCPVVRCHPTGSLLQTKALCSSIASSLFLSLEKSMRKWSKQRWSVPPATASDSISLRAKLSTSRKNGTHQSIRVANDAFSDMPAHFGWIGVHELTVPIGHRMPWS